MRRIDIFRNHDPHRHVFARDQLISARTQNAAQNRFKTLRGPAFFKGTINHRVNINHPRGNTLHQIGKETAIRINQVCEDYIRRRAIRHLEKGRVVIFAAGTGNPFFTTDSAASLRAIEINADLMLKATKVDGIYSADPFTDTSATRYTHLTYDEVIDQRLGVMDTTAIVLCRDNGMPLRVFDINKPGDLMDIAMGGDVGTLVDNNPTRANR